MEHYFTVGARVAVGQMNGTYRTDYVARIHRNGNIVLRSDPRQQWRPSGKSAFKTGERGWSRQVAHLWADDDAALTERIAAANRSAHVSDLIFRLSRMDVRRATDATVSHLEAAIRSIPSKET
jgi:hypothetical protein